MLQLSLVSCNLLVMKQTPEKRSTIRATYSIPIPLAKNLRHVAKRLHISQSALVSCLLTPQVQHLLVVCRDMPPSERPPRRQVFPNREKGNAKELEAMVHAALDRLV